MFSKVLTGSILSRISDEDLCSQFNFMWTAYIIAAMGILVTMVQYVGNPIYCWCPAELPQVQCNYTTALCWVKENYHVREGEVIPVEEEDRHHTTVSYYPWVPWVLMLMSATTNLPHVIWRASESSSGLDLRKLVCLADSHDSAENLAKIMRIWLVRTNTGEKSMVSRAKAFFGSVGVFKLGKHHRTYLCGLVILVKFLYLLLSVMLYVSLNIFIDEDFLYYGYEVFENFLQGLPQNSYRFPKQTLCDIQIRQMSNFHTYTMQCLLPINIYNEKIFIFLWFWFIILISVNAYSLFRWSFCLLAFSSRRRFVKGYVVILFDLIQKKNPIPRDKTKNNAHSGQTDSREEDSSEQDRSEAAFTEEGRLDALFTDQDRSDAAFTDQDGVASSTDFLNNHPKLKRMRPVTRRSTRPTKYIRNMILPHHPPSRPTHSGSSIETNEFEIMNEKRKKEINRITTKMLKHLGHDGVAVFRTLEHAVGIVIASEIFLELYQQLNDVHHLQ